MATKERPTLRTLASMTGLAVATVSRALANDPQIAPDTRSRVATAARTIGYSPDRAAQRLRTGRTNVIALVLNPHEEIIGYGSSMISGLTRTLRGTPYHLVVMPNFADREPLEQVENIVRNRLADGVLLSRTEPGDMRVRLLLEREFPFVSHGRTELATPHPFVDYDNFEFARTAAQRLAKQGVRRPSMIPAPSHLTFAQHLRMGFLRGCAEAGLEGKILDGVTLDSPPDTIYAHIAHLIESGSLPDGLVCPGETSAMAVYAACSDAGHADKCRLVMKSTSQVAGFIRPRIDSIFEDLAAAGERMGTLLLRSIKGEPAEELNYLQPVPSSGSTGIDGDKE
jgi:LacI family transcriptional regulator